MLQMDFVECLLIMQKKAKPSPGFPWKLLKISIHKAQPLDFPIKCRKQTS